MMVRAEIGSGNSQVCVHASAYIGVQTLFNMTTSSILASSILLPSISSRMLPGQETPHISTTAVPGIQVIVVECPG